MVKPVLEQSDSLAPALELWEMLNTHFMAIALRST